jgi:hypothetical protein
VKHLFCRCFNPFRVADVIESFSDCNSAQAKDFKALDEESDNIGSATASQQEEDERENNVVFETRHFTSPPLVLVGANIPSIYGGLTINAWDKYKHSSLLPKTLIKGQDQDLRQGN